MAPWPSTTSASTGPSRSAAASARWRSDARDLPRACAAAEAGLVELEHVGVGGVGRLAGRLGAAVAARPVAALQDVGVLVLLRGDHPLFDVARHVVGAVTADAARAAAALLGLIET